MACSSAPVMKSSDFQVLSISLSSKLACCLNPSNAFISLLYFSIIISLINPSGCVDVYFSFNNLMVSILATGAKISSKSLCHAQLYVSLLLTNLALCLIIFPSAFFLVFEYPIFKPIAFVTRWLQPKGLVAFQFAFIIHLVVDMIDLFLLFYYSILRVVSNRRETVMLGDDRSINVMGKGTIRLLVNGFIQVITSVFYVPGLQNNLLSSGQLMEKGLEILKRGGACKIYHPEKGLILEIPMAKNMMFKFFAVAQAKKETCFNSSMEDRARLWHRRYGHLSFNGLNLLKQKEMVRGLPHLGTSSSVCEDCLVGKQQRNPFPQESTWRASQVLELVHADICGPINPLSNSNKRYIITFIDDYSRKVWVYFLVTKSEAFVVFKQYKSRVEKESGVAIKGLRTDRGGEFTSVEFTNFCNDNGIHRQLTAPYTPQQNGIAERKNRTIMNMQVGIGRRVTIAGNSNGSGIDATGENIELGSTNVEESETNTSSEDHSSSSSENLPPMNDAQRRRQPPTWMQEYESGEDLPHGAKKVGVKWVYKTKYNENGEVEKYKARLVAKGYTQKCGIDYTEVFAPVARLETVRLVMSLAAQNDWVLFQLDVKSAFLHGELNEEVFIDQPPGYIKKGAEQKVYRLKKALYGLKQAPRAWYSRIESYFTKEGFKRCPYEHTLFVKAGERVKILIVCIYVDDLIFTGNDKQMYVQFKTLMMNEFDMTDLGKVRYFLGIEVRQNEAGVFICQKRYAQGVLERFNMEKCNSVQNPIVPGCQLTRDEKGLCWREKVPANSSQDGCLVFLR
ncbi:retrovirus-related pol polyprotein from transposon TNT 1-94 [Tanacetum coccineum]